MASSLASPRALHVFTRCMSPPRDPSPGERQEAEAAAAAQRGSSSGASSRMTSPPAATPGTPSRGIMRRGTVSFSPASFLKSPATASGGGGGGVMTSSLTATSFETSSSCATTSSGAYSGVAPAASSASVSSSSANSSSGCSSFGSSSTRLPSRTLCPPSPITIQPNLGGGMVGRRPVHSASMHFGTNHSPKATRFQHVIPHVWVRRNTFRYSDQMCALCRRQLGFGFITTWEKCKSCKTKVHTHCKSKMGDTCGLTAEHLRAIIDNVVQQGNMDAWGGGVGGLGPPASAHPSMAGSRSMHESTAFQYPDTAAIIDSSSSTNSSAPSTPAFANVAGGGSAGGMAQSPFICRSAIDRGNNKIFTFPDCLPEVDVPDIVLPEGSDDRPGPSSARLGGKEPPAFQLDQPPLGGRSQPSAALIGSQDSDATVRTTEGSEGTMVVDSQGSNGDGSTMSDLSPGGNSNRSEHKWDRHRWNMSTIRGATGQSGWSDVTIPVKNIDFGPKNLIGHGRFGTVHRGYHFGDVAVKFLNMDHVEEAEKEKEFKAEVAQFKNTRHDNIVLCLGYCFDHQKLGIVMGLCKGRTLYSILHSSGGNEKVDLTTAVNYATQICQGVSYLHQKQIINKDLRSKNIFIEAKSRVVITDLGLFSMKRLRFPERNDSIRTPSHWLSYLAPELIREIAGDLRELPFSEQSDVFAFGTIWFELLTSSMPFSDLHPDQVIYRVGSGLGAPLPNINAVREVKELLTRAWTLSPAERPAFSACLAMLQALPRLRVDRSPSHPLGRSFESIF